VVVDGLRQGLRELGLEEGKGIVLDVRDTKGDLKAVEAMVVSQATLIIDAARAKRWPTMFAEDSLVAKGALASYGHSYHEIGRISARHVQRVLGGANPQDLPVENFDRVDLVLNLRTAREIGLAIPQSILIRARRVIE
jgi:putative ABC transport system substrate-binding protein